MRLYRHNVYGNSSAPHAGLVLAQGDALALRMNASRGLNHPGLDAALLNAIVPPLAGAPESWRSLKPEQMDHVELGARWSPARGKSLDVSAFSDSLKNRYVFAFPPAVALPSFTNLGDYRVRGLEATWQQQWNTAWSSFAGVTLLDSTLADLPYAPKRALAAGITWRDGAWRVSGDAQAQSAMFVLNKARADGAPNTAHWRPGRRRPSCKGRFPSGRGQRLPRAWRWGCGRWPATGLATSTSDPFRAWAGN